MGDNECVWRPMESILWKEEINCARERWDSQQGRRSVCTDATGTLEFPAPTALSSLQDLRGPLPQVHCPEHEQHPQMCAPQGLRSEQVESSMGLVDSGCAGWVWIQCTWSPPLWGGGDWGSERTGLAWTSSLHPPPPHSSIPRQEIWEFQTESHLLDHYKGVFVETGGCNVFWCNNCELLL